MQRTRSYRESGSDATYPSLGDGNHAIGNSFPPVRAGKQNAIRAALDLCCDLILSSGGVIAFDKSKALCLCGPLVLSFTQAHLCDTPFCNISRDNCAIPHKNKHEVNSRYYHRKRAEYGFGEYGFKHRTQ